MQYKKTKLSALLLLSIGLTGLQVQEAIPTTGNNASGSGGYVSYTVGQDVYTTGAEGSVAQGVQQPYEISVLTGLGDAKDINLVCSAYPNPATDYVILTIDSISLEFS